MQLGKTNGDGNEGGGGLTVVAVQVREVQGRNRYPNMALI